MQQSIQPAPRRLAIFDLDGTLTRHDTFFPFVLGLLGRHPSRWPRVALLVIPALGYLLRLLDRGGLKGAILYWLFRGLPRGEVNEWAQRYAAAVVPARMFAEALNELRMHLASGDHVVVLSASPDLFVPDIARKIGAQEVICTQIRWTGEQLDGRLAGPNRRDHEKSRVVDELRSRLPGLRVIAYGNSTADLIHMYRCEQGVYVNASPSLAARLTQRGLRCVQWRLKA
ncbi:MAG: HAD-IB family phosphatase [Steroidobacteraceae bacterium]